MRYDVRIEDRLASVELEVVEGGWRVREHTDDGPTDWSTVPGRWAGPGELLLTLNGRQRAIGTHAHSGSVALQVDGHALDASVVDPSKARADLAGGSAQGVVSTPMPGVVVRIPVEVGQEVRAGEVLVVVEAMKMENEFKSPVAGVVDSIQVAVGQALEAKAVLAIVVEP